MGLKMIFYLTNVTNAVNLSQPSVCIGGGLHAPSFRTALIFDISFSAIDTFAIK